MPYIKVTLHTGDLVKHVFISADGYKNVTAGLSAEESQALLKKILLFADNKKMFNDALTEGYFIPKIVGLNKVYNFAVVNLGMTTQPPKDMTIRKMQLQSLDLVDKSITVEEVDEFPLLQKYKQRVMELTKLDLRPNDVQNRDKQNLNKWRQLGSSKTEIRSFPKNGQISSHHIINAVLAPIQKKPVVVIGKIPMTSFNKAMDMVMNDLQKELTNISIQKERIINNKNYPLIGYAVLDKKRLEDIEWLRERENNLRGILQNFSIEKTETIQKQCNQIRDENKSNGYIKDLLTGLQYKSPTDTYNFLKNTPKIKNIFNEIHENAKNIYDIENLIKAIDEIDNYLATAGNVQMDLHKAMRTAVYKEQKQDLLDWSAILDSQIDSIVWAKAKLTSSNIDLTESIDGVRKGPWYKIQQVIAYFDGENKKITWEQPNQLILHRVENENKEHIVFYQNKLYANIKNALFNLIEIDRIFIGTKLTYPLPQSGEKITKRIADGSARMITEVINEEKISTKVDLRNLKKIAISRLAIKSFLGGEKPLTRHPQLHKLYKLISQIDDNDLMSMYRISCAIEKLSAEAGSSILKKQGLKS